MDNVEIRNSEIYINNVKGINCSNTFNLSNFWPLGQYIIKKIIEVVNYYTVLCIIAKNF
jgi:hypothetical protein